MITCRIVVKGVVQGVGFRPFIKRSADRFVLNGYVKNSSIGLEIALNVESIHTAEDFVGYIKVNKPINAVIKSIESSEIENEIFEGFSILKSDVTEGLTLISPDLAICKECEQDIFDSSNRRYLYPFTNCTNCGPRYSIIKSIPYDRSNTTMSDFILCDKCRDEYEDSDSRRFHAEPNACADCGPSLTLYDGNDVITDNKLAIKRTAERINNGEIVAIKGLSGFHFILSAYNDEAILKLRELKKRPTKPFAVMVRDISVIDKYVENISTVERELLTSGEAPIVILNNIDFEKLGISKFVNPICFGDCVNENSSAEDNNSFHNLSGADNNKNCNDNDNDNDNYNDNDNAESNNNSSDLAGVHQHIENGNNSLGIMIAYTPLHKLLFNFYNSDFLIATSANIGDEPVISDINEAMKKLSNFTDIFLDHNRVIHTRLDDSVIASLDDGYQFIRRSRSYAPYPIDFDKIIDTDIFAVGADLKSTLALYKNGYAFLSQYIGDLESIATYDYFDETYKKLSSVLGIKPEVIVRDCHDGFMSSKYADKIAKDLSVNVVKVQHHVAHFLSVLAEHKYVGDSIGVVLDGFGLGLDNLAWGGEFFLKIDRKISRVFSLKKYTQPSMDASVKSPYMMLISYLSSMNLLVTADSLLKERLSLSDNEINIVKQISDKYINSIYTSSVGRLFEAVGSLLLCERDNEYEGSLAIKLESIVDKSEQGYYHFTTDDGVLDFKDVFNKLISDLYDGELISVISAKFHNGFIKVVADILINLSQESGVKHISLSGGVFQNKILLNGITKTLEERDLMVYRNNVIPTNDSSISLGQIYYYLYDIEFNL